MITERPVSEPRVPAAYVSACRHTVPRDAVRLYESWVDTTLPEWFCRRCGVFRAVTRRKKVSTEGVARDTAPMRR